MQFFLRLRRATNETGTSLHIALLDHQEKFLVVALELISQVLKQLGVLQIAPKILKINILFTKNQFLEDSRRLSVEELRAWSLDSTSFCQRSSWRKSSVSAGLEGWQNPICTLWEHWGWTQRYRGTLCRKDLWKRPKIYEKSAYFPPQDLLPLVKPNSFASLCLQGSHNHIYIVIPTAQHWSAGPQVVRKNDFSWKKIPPNLVIWEKTHLCGFIHSFGDNLLHISSNWLFVNEPLARTEAKMLI